MWRKKIKSRKPNLFEVTLLIMGIIAISVGYFFVHGVSLRYDFQSFEMTVTLLMWFGLIILIILTAVSENSKEELKIIISQQHDEIKLLRDDFKRRR